MRHRTAAATVLLLATLVVTATEALAQPTLGLQLSATSLRPGQSLVVGATVNNPGNGPLADFYFVMVLPDGSTAISAGLGLGLRVGRLGDLRSLVPVATSISLLYPFQYAANPFFSYAFTSAEPRGTYRLYFAAVRTGAFNDGVIGPSDLLAVAAQDFTVTDSPIVVDPQRAVTATISPAGGVVQTTSAGGTVLKLTLPPGAVSVPTPITIAPLVSFEGSPGPVVAGISAGPSGLRLSPPATLTITLPPGFQSSAFGLRGVLTDDVGQNRQFLPVTQVGNVVTMTVPHFSVAEIEVLLDLDDIPCTPGQGFPFPAEQAAACAAIDPLADAEAVRLAGQGGPISQAFKNSMAAVLDVWLTNGLLPRLLDAQSETPFRLVGKIIDVSNEWGDFLDMYRVLFGLSDRANQAAGRPLGAKIDQAQERLRLALIARMNAVNIQCLVQKSLVDRWVFEVDFLNATWDGQFPGGAPTSPFDLVFCVNLAIDAAPPSVLTPGQAAVLPIDVRLRFTDGVDLSFPGLQGAVSVTATNATVTPAGGVVPLPVSANLSLRPTANSSTVTITAAVVTDSLGLLPPRTRTFQAGQAPVLNFTGREMISEVRLDRSSALGGVIVAKDSTPSFVNGVTTTATMPSSTVMVGNLGLGYVGSGSTTATRTVTTAPGAVTVGFTGQTQISLAAIANYGGQGEEIAGSVSDSWCVTLPSPFDLTPAFTGNPEAVLIGPPTIDLTTSGTVRLAAGSWCLSYFDVIRKRLAGGVVTGPSSGTPSYGLTFRPAP